MTSLLSHGRYCVRSFVHLRTNLQVEGGDDEAGDDDWVDVESLQSVDSVGEAAEMTAMPRREDDDDSVSSESDGEAADAFIRQNRSTSPKQLATSVHAPTDGTSSPRDVRFFLFEDRR